MTAAESGDLEALKSILDTNQVHVGELVQAEDTFQDLTNLRPVGCIDVCDTRGVNALLLAAAAGHEAAVALLLDKGAHINQCVHCYQLGAWYSSSCSVSLMKACLRLWLPIAGTEDFQSLV